MFQIQNIALANAVWYVLTIKVTGHGFHSSIVKTLIVRANFGRPASQVGKIASLHVARDAATKIGLVLSHKIDKTVMEPFSYDQLVKKCLSSSFALICHENK